MQLSPAAARPATPPPLVLACVSVPVLALPHGGGDFRAAVLRLLLWRSATWARPARPGTVGVALRRNATLTRAALGAALLQALAGATRAAQRGADGAWRATRPRTRRGHLDRPVGVDAGA